MKKTGYRCAKCGHKKLLRYLWLKARFCIWCIENTNTDINIGVFENISIKENLRVRRKGKGFRKFISEFLGGWFPSGDLKLKDGVYKTRSADKEMDTYDEVVKDAQTGKMIHKCHEPLSQHRK